MHVHEVLAVLEGGTPGVPWLLGLLLVGGAVVLERGLGVLRERLEAGHLAAFGFESRLSLGNGRRFAGAHDEGNLERTTKWTKASHHSEGEAHCCSTAEDDSSTHTFTEGRCSSEAS